MQLQLIVLSRTHHYHTIVLRELDDIAEFTQLKTMPSDSKPEANAQQPNTTQALALLAVIFGSALLMLFLVYLSFPNLDQ